MFFWICKCRFALLLFSRAILSAVVAHCQLQGRGGRRRNAPTTDTIQNIIVYWSCVAVEIMGLLLIHQRFLAMLKEGQESLSDGEWLRLTSLVYQMAELTRQAKQEDLKQRAALGDG